MQGQEWTLIPPSSGYSAVAFVVLNCHVWWWDLDHEEEIINLCVLHNPVLERGFLLT